MRAVRVAIVGSPARWHSATPIARNLDHRAPAVRPRPDIPAVRVDAGNPPQAFQESRRCSPTCRSRSQAARERIRAAISNPFSLDVKDYAIGVSQAVLAKYDALYAGVVRRLGKD